MPSSPHPFPIGFADPHSPPEVPPPEPKHYLAIKAMYSKFFSIDAFSEGFYDQP
jgi:hypothetical protein